MKDEVWSGDGMFDPVGHLAKFGAYTLLHMLTCHEDFSFRITTDNCNTKVLSVPFQYLSDFQ